MARVQVDNEASQVTPAAGKSKWYVDSTYKELIHLGDDGVHRVVRSQSNTNTGDVPANAANTYLTGSSISMPPDLLRAKASFRWVFAMSKTNAGIAQPIWTVVFGTAGTTADTVRLTFTGTAQTAAVDNGIATIDVVARSVGSGTSGVLEGVFSMTHTLAATNQTTGLQTQATQVLQATSSGFDTTVASSIIGVCCNPGASGSWTFQHVSAQAWNL